ncbi:MAG: hypothetical protein ACREOO_13335 [bacterium]
MLQRGLSNRPTGAVALMLLGAAYLLNTASTRDHQNLGRTSLFGAQVKQALVAVQRTGAMVDRMILSWGEMLESESINLGCLKKDQVIAQRTRIVKTCACPICNFIFHSEIKKLSPSSCPKRNSKLILPQTIGTQGIL